MATHETRLIEASEGDTAGSVLASAFSQDPVFGWALDGHFDVEARLRKLFVCLVAAELAKPSCHIDVAAAGGAVALWHGVDDWATSNRELVRAFPAVLGAFGRRLPRALRLLTMLEKVHPDAPHMHLAYIGVHRDQQGGGLGGALLESATERLDTQGFAAYLENSNPRNEAFYARYGFEASGPIELPPGAPPMMAMWREPRNQ